MPALRACRGAACGRALCQSCVYSHRGSRVFIRHNYAILNVAANHFSRSCCVGGEGAAWRAVGLSSACANARCGSGCPCSHSGCHCWSPGSDPVSPAPSIPLGAEHLLLSHPCRDGGTLPGGAHFLETCVPELCTAEMCEPQMCCAEVRVAEMCTVRCPSSRGAQLRTGRLGRARLGSASSSRWVLVTVPPRVPTQPRFCSLSPGLCFAVQTCLSWQAAPWLRWEPGRANRRHERRGWREIPPFREQTAAEIDFFPLFTRVSSPRCRAERPRITITCSEVRARFAECVYYYQGLKTIPNHPVFSSFLFFFFPLHSHSFSLSCFLKRGALAARC